MGLGNSLYRLNRRRAAAAAFRSATLRHPGNAAAFNNLAHVLGELGRFGEAEAAARKAIALGGPDVATYRATLRDILARRKRNSGGKP
jgi:Flp pilus assembly protein TadD